MAEQVQFRRGTTAQQAAFTGAIGEITVDTDKKVPVVSDGATLGGFPLPQLHAANTWALGQTITAGGLTVNGGTTTLLTTQVTGFTATQAGVFSTTLGVTGQATLHTVTVTSFTATQLAAFTSGTFSTTLGVTGVATLTGGFNATANSTIGGTPPSTGKLGIVGASGGISLSLSDNVNNSFYVKHSSGAVALGTDGSGAIAICANGFTPVITCSVASSKANVTWNTPPTSSAGLATGTIYSNVGIATFA